jgi:hypothetical protein
MSKHSRLNPSRVRNPRQSPRPSSGLVESCESRILMAIDVAIGTGTAARSLAFIDADGTTGTVRVAGGAATVQLDGTNLTQTPAGSTVTVGGTNVVMTGITITGTNPSVTISTTPVGDGKVTLGGITAAGPVRAVTGRGVILGGTTSLSNGIGKLDVGATQNATITITRAGQALLQDAAVTIGTAQDTSINSQQPLRQLRVGSWAAGDPAVPDGVTTLRINKLQSAGDFAADIALSGNGQLVGAPVLGNAKITGALASGNWNVAGKTSRVAAGSVGSGWSGTFGDLARFSTTGDLAGNLTAASINSLSAGTMTGADIRVSRTVAEGGQALNRLSARGAMINTTVRSDGNIGTVSAASMNDCIIFAGIQGGRPQLPDAAADFVSGATIRNVTIRNRLPAPAFNDSKIAAANLGRINLGEVQVTNGGDVFGLAGQAIDSFSAVSNGTPMRGVSLTEPSQTLVFTDFVVRVF